MTKGWALNHTTMIMLYIVIFSDVQYELFYKTNMS